MKILLIGAILALGMVFTRPAPAGPWQGGGMFDVQAQRQRPGGFQRQPEPKRDFRRNERPPERAQRPGGLTEEERRELRRDIDRANREIYKGRPQR